MTTKGTEIDMKYRNIYIVQPVRHDLSALRNWSNNLLFITTGYEHLSELRKTIEANLLEFDPTVDAIVMVGKVSTNLILGIALANIFHGQEISIGKYYDNGYHWERVKV